MSTCKCKSHDLFNFGCRCGAINKNAPATQTAKRSVKAVITDRQLSTTGINFGFILNGNGETTDVAAKFKQGVFVDYAKIENCSDGTVNNNVQLHGLVANGSKVWIDIRLTPKMKSFGPMASACFEIVILKTY